LLAEDAAAKAAAPRPPAHASPGDAVHPLLHLQRAAGNAAVTDLLHPAPAESVLGARAAVPHPPSLRSPADRHEREADAVVDEVVHTSSPIAPHTEHATSARADRDASNGAAPASVTDALASPARMLDSSTRGELEARLGHDLSGVRVHVGSTAERSVRELDATAYTVGSHIVVDPAHFAPHTQTGRRLLAHELTHVLQQTAERSVGDRGGDGGVPALASISSAPTGTVQRQAASKDELRKRLDDVRRQLATGSGVRTNEATAALKEEEARLAAALQQATAEELRRQVEANRKQQATGSGVRSPQAAAQLKEEEDQLQRRMAANAGLGAAAMPAVKGGGPTASPNAPLVDWSGGNLRGLAAEQGVIGSSYPGATQLPKGFPGADLVEGGTQSPLTGFGRGKAGKLPLSADSTFVEGGTVVQVKTMKNSLPYYQEPNAVLKTLEKGMQDLANVKPGTGKSEQVGQEFRRVEVGQPARRILHVELEVAPTPEQLAQLEQLKEAGKSYGSFGPGEEVEVVVKWPGAQPKSFFRNIEMAPGTGSGVLNVGLAAAGMYSRGKWRESQLEREGYAARGVAAHQGSGAAAQAGAFARGDSFDMNGPPSARDFNLSVWQSRVREVTAARKPGDKLTINWQLHTRENRTLDVSVTYEKLADGTWRAGPPSEDMEGHKVPDLDRIIDPKASNLDVEIELGIKGA